MSLSLLCSLSFKNALLFKRHWFTTVLQLFVIPLSLYVAFTKLLSQQFVYHKAAELNNELVIDIGDKSLSEILGSELWSSGKAVGIIDPTFDFTAQQQSFQSNTSTFADALRHSNDAIYLTDIPTLPKLSISSVFQTWLMETDSRLKPHHFMYFPNYHEANLYYMNAWERVQEPKLRKLFAIVEFTHVPLMNELAALSALTTHPDSPLNNSAASQHNHNPEHQQPQSNPNAESKSVQVNDHTISYILHNLPTTLNTNHFSILDLNNGNPLSEFFHFNVRSVTGTSGVIDRTIYYYYSYLYRLLSTSPTSSSITDFPQFTKSLVPSTLNVTFHAFPSPSHTDSTIQDYIDSLGPRYLIISLIPLSISTFLFLSLEHHNRMYQLFLTLGCSHFALNYAWIVSHAIASLPTLVLLYRLFTTSLFPSIPSPLILIPLVLYFIINATYTLLITALTTTICVKFSSNQVYSHSTLSSKPFTLLYTLILTGLYFLPRSSTFLTSTIETLFTTFGAPSSLLTAPPISTISPDTQGSISIPSTQTFITTILFPNIFNTSQLATYLTDLILALTSFPFLFNQLFTYYRSKQFHPAFTLQSMFHPTPNQTLSIGVLFAIATVHIVALFKLSQYFYSTIHQPNLTTSPTNSHSFSSPQNNTAVDIRNVKKSYNSNVGETINAIHDFSMRFDYGSIYAILGVNGASKSTLLSLINGTLQQDHGTIEFHPNQKTTNDRNISHELRPNIGVVPQHISLYQELTPYEHIVVCEKIQRSLLMQRPKTSSSNVSSPAALTDSDIYSISNRLQLSTVEFTQNQLLSASGSEFTQKVIPASIDAQSAMYMHRCVSELSGGQIRKTQLAMALVHSPRVLICDEITRNVDVVGQRHIWNELLRLRNDGEMCIISSTHSFNEAEQIGDQIVILVPGGRPVAAGSNFSLKQQFNVGYTLSTKMSLLEHGNVRETFLSKPTINYNIQSLYTQLQTIYPTVRMDFNREILSQLSTTQSQSNKVDFVDDRPKDIILQFMLRTEDSNDLVPILDYLDQHMAKFNVLDYSISLTTLRDVFFKACEGYISTSEAPRERTTQQLPHKQDNKAELSGMNKSDPLFVPYTPLRGISLTIAQIKALVQRRLYIHFADKKTLAFLILAPALLLAFALLLSGSLLRSPTHDVSPTYFNNPETYCLYSTSIHNTALSSNPSNKNDKFAKSFCPFPDYTQLVAFDFSSQFEEIVDQDGTSLLAPNSTFDSVGAAHKAIVTEFNPSIFRANYHDKARYLGIVVPYLETSTRNQRDDGIGLKSISALVYSNTTAAYSHITALNQFTSKLLNVGYSLSDHDSPQTFSIKSSFHSLPNVTFYTLSKFGCLFVMLFGFVLFHVPFQLNNITAEENDKITHHLYLSNLKPLAYWTSHFIVDSLISILAIACLQFVIHLFNAHIIPPLHLFFILLFYTTTSTLWVYNAVLTTWHQDVTKILLPVALSTLHVLYLAAMIVLVLTMRYPFYLFFLGVIFPPYLALATLLAFDENIKALFPDPNSGHHLFITSIFMLIVNAILLSVLQTCHRNRSFQRLYNCFVRSFTTTASSRPSNLTNNAPPSSSSQPTHCTSNMDQQRQFITQQRPQNNPQQYPIVLSGLHREFGSNFIAVNDLYVTVKKHSVFCLLGPNSAGKSTILSMLTGLLYPTIAPKLINPTPPHTAFINGYDITTDWLQCIDEDNGGIGYVPQYDPLSVELTPYQLLLTYAVLRGMPNVPAADGHDVYAENTTVAEFNTISILQQLGLQSVMYRPISTLSGGQARRVSIATGLIGCPRLILLDEPTNQIDIQSKEFIYSTIRNLKLTSQSQSTHDRQVRESSIVLTSHDLNEVELLGDTIAILAHGQFKALDSKHNLQSAFSDSFRLNLSYTVAQHHNEKADQQKPSQLSNPNLSLLIQRIMCLVFASHHIAPSTRVEDVIHVSEAHGTNIAFEVQKSYYKLVQILEKLKSVQSSLDNIIADIELTKTDMNKHDEAQIDSIIQKHLKQPQIQSQPQQHHPSPNITLSYSVTETTLEQIFFQLVADTPTTPNQ